MRIIYATEYDGTRAQLEAQVQWFTEALAAHALTIDQPAPLAGSDLVDELARSGVPFKLEAEFDWAWRSTGVGRAVQARRVSPFDPLADDEQVVSFDPTGMIVDDTGTLRAETADELLAKARRARDVYINGRRDEFIAGGVQFMGWPFDSDPASIQNLTAAVAFIQAAPNYGMPAPEAVSWRDANNVDHDLTPAQLVALGAVVFGRVQQAHFTARALKDQIAAATTQGEVAAVDWPA